LVGVPALLAIVARAAHAFHYSSPREVADLLIRFLDEDHSDV
jgi:hypothetical protein